MVISSDQAGPILGRFRQILDRDPDRVLFTFVNEAGRDQETMTAGQLARAAEGVASSLRSWQFVPGDRVVLVFPPSLDFIRAFIGCLMAGVVPVPAYPPDPLRLRTSMATFSAVVASSGARAALTNGPYSRARTVGAVAGRLSRQALSWPALPWYRTDRRPLAGNEPVRWHEPAEQDEPAFLQYTSGSTATPRGVVITHRNLQHEVAANARDLGLGAGTRAVCWLPQYHDLGLISILCSTVAGNGHSYLMSPLTFLRRPAVWFEVMSRVRATHTAAPNFAFELAVRKTTPQQRAGWDLRSLQVAMSAAEPIRPETVEAFLTAFAPAGLSAEAFYGAYGLAEHTVSVTMGGRRMLRLERAAVEDGRAVPLPAGDQRPSATYVSCGRVSKPDARVRIVDPALRRVCPPGQVGEIWVDSATKAAGYYGLTAETDAAFRARVDGEDDPTEYLRSGDLGFFHDGELYVTGRLKDLIIINGRNLYPQDLEDGVRDCHPLIRPGGVAAFAVERPGELPAEQLTLFVESRQARLTGAEQEEIAAAVRRRLFEDYQVACRAVVLGQPGLVRKTTSGKVRRAACRQAFEDGSVQRADTTIRVFVDDTSDPALIA